MNDTFKLSFHCRCGKEHNAHIRGYFAENGAIERLSDCVRQCGSSRVFLLADENTYAAAGDAVCAHLNRSGISYSLCILHAAALEPDEAAVGAAIMRFDRSCDMVVGIGSGVINDIGKIVSHTAGVPYIIVATAPSMDGYASATSSMALDGLKVSLPSRCADYILGDLDVLTKAPTRMLIAGLGDMLAKYISLGEWKIAHLITGEYYCETLADMVRSALQACIDHADGLLRREPAAVKAVFEGLVIGGVAMNYAGVSRPASGVEHYFSHVWDMRGLEFGTPVDLHGIQCAIGTLYAARIYDRLRDYTPDREQAIQYVESFDYAAYQTRLRAFLGKSAEGMIALEKKEQKYSPEKHRTRLQRILTHWGEIQTVIRQEIPTARTIEKILDQIHAPKTVTDIGIDPAVLPMTFEATKDMRDKYVLSRLCFDLGILPEVNEAVFGGD